MKEDLKIKIDKFLKVANSETIWELYYTEDNSNNNYMFCDKKNNNIVFCFSNYEELEDFITDKIENYKIENASDEIKEVFEEYFIKSSIEDKLNIYSCKY